MTTYEEVHSGAVVLGHDGALWGVEHIEHEPALMVTLVRPGFSMTGYPPPGTEITVVVPADVSAEARAAGLLIEAFGSVDLIAEHYEEVRS